MGFLDKFNIQAGKTEAEKSKESEPVEKPERQSELLDGDDFSVDDLYKLKSNDTILALDIGTEFVKAVIARQDSDKNLEIIGAGKARQSEGNMYAGAIADIPSVVKVCEKAVAAAEKIAEVSSKTTVVGIAGELIKGSTSTVRYRRKSGNKPLSEQEMALIIKQVQEHAGAQRALSRTVFRRAL